MFFYQLVFKPFLPSQNNYAELPRKKKQTIILFILSVYWLVSDQDAIHNTNVLMMAGHKKTKNKNTLLFFLTYHKHIFIRIPDILFIKD